MAKKLARGGHGAPSGKILNAVQPKAAPVEEFDIGTKIRALRRSRRLTLRDVARETGFSPALISQIENDNVSPPIATLARIARVLRVKVGYFFEEGDIKHRFEVVRVGERRKVKRVMSLLGSRRGYAFEALAFSVRYRKMAPVMLTMAKDSDNPESLYTHDGEEFLMLLSGRAELLIEEERYELEPGDSAYLDGALRHRLVRVGEEEARVLTIVCR
jgi:transcriptional regulator with XRE-family HTH domain